MKIVRRTTLFLITISVLTLSCKAQSGPHEDNIPPKREFRAVWIATIANIDWPSRKDLSPDRQRKEFTELLDFHAGVGMNAVFVQVRAAGDAFYAKGKEPWSEWLTGVQGKPPVPFYDPMEFMVAESHRRGMEFHAWLNLNRIVHKSAGSVSPQNFSVSNPEWVLTYDGYKLFNFGLQEVRDFITGLTVNIAKNYDVDGIHFDDYFYPYAVAGQRLNDDHTFRQYGKGFANKADWRRHNIDLLIKQIHDALEEVNPRLKFGVSPVGVWRNRRDDVNGSETTGGLTAYDHLYADGRKWIKEGWVDYIVPQIYFSTGFKKNPFKNLVDWWTELCNERHFYVGQAAYRAGYVDTDPHWHKPGELASQVRYLREQHADGSVFFSSASLKRNSLGITDSLRRFYSYPALIPTMPWKDDILPNPPRRLKAVKSEDGLRLSWVEPNAAADGETARYYVIYRFGPDEKPGASDPRQIVGICYEGETFIDRTARSGNQYVYYITSVDRLHNESRPAGPLKLIITDNGLEPFE